MYFFASSVTKLIKKAKTDNVDQLLIIYSGITID